MWKQETVEQLRRDWADGLSVVQIGKRTGLGKNAVVGKAHRLGLLPRPSPIHRGQAPAEPPITPRAHPLPPGATTLPPLASLSDPL